LISNGIVGKAIRIPDSVLDSVRIGLGASRAAEIKVLKWADNLNADVQVGKAVGIKAGEVLFKRLM
jgi:hypothetical protein